MSYSDPDPMSQVRIEQEGLRLSRKLTSVSDEMLELAEEVGRAEHAYKLAYARAIFRATGTVAEKEATATRDSEIELLAHKLAEAKMKALRDVASSLRTQIEWMRTLAANVRERVAHPSGRGG